MIISHHTKVLSGPCLNGSENFSETADTSGQVTAVMGKWKKRGKGDPLNRL